MKETFYFSHDYTSRSDAKIKDLIFNHGLAGYGIYWCLIEDLYLNDNCLPFDCRRIAHELHCDKDIVLSVLKDFDLFIIENGFFYSLSIQKRLDKRNEKSEKARSNASKRWNDANAMPSHSERNAIKDNKVKDNKVKDIKIKDKKVLHLFADSEYFDFEKFCLKLPDWSNDKCKFYHDAAIGYSESKGAKYLDWIAAVKNWDRKQPYTKTKNNYEAGKQQRDELRNRAEQFIANKLFGS
jgi:hypothetical protein